MKTTNKQGITPSIYSHHHTQDLTCDCRNCGVEFTQYHRGHVMCSKECSWEKRGANVVDMACTDCGCTDRAPHNNLGYCCDTCKKLRLNPDRTDVTRRTPPEPSDLV